MTGSEISIVLGAAVLTAVLAWYFFGPKKARQAEMDDGVQVVKIKVQGGYSPDVIQVFSGVPVRLEFDRQEAGDCSSRLVMPDFKVNELLPAWETTSIEFTPQAVGDFGFACGMNMMRGRLQVLDRDPELVEVSLPASVGGSPVSSAHVADASTPVREVASQPVEPETTDVRPASIPDAGDAEERERAAEIADLGRRVIIGASLSAPVVFAVMAMEVFGATWVPDLLMNRFFQLVMITPVFFFTGWPIHRTGWLALSHRTADMNSLITLGTIAAYGYSLVATFIPVCCPRSPRRSTTRPSASSSLSSCSAG